MRIKSIFALPVGLGICLGTLSACQKPLPSQPAWLAVSQHPDFPAARYLIGVGRGANVEQAKRAAHSALVRQIHERINRQLAVDRHRVCQAGFCTLRLDTAAQLMGKPIGLRTALTWSSPDGRQHAAMAIADRLEISAAAAEQIRAYEEQCQRLADVARDLSGEAPYFALLNRLAALLMRAQAEEQRTYLAAVDPGPPIPARGPSTGDLVSAIEGTIGAIRFYPALGNGLAVRAAEKNVTLVLGADWFAARQRQPAASIPIRFELPGDAEAPVLLSRVDPAGMAPTAISTVRPFAGTTFEVLARIDDDRVLAEAGLPAGDARFAHLARLLQKPTARFRLSVTDERAGRVALVIAEMQVGQFRQHSRVVEGLKRKLTRAGYNVLELDELQIDLPAKPTPKSMAKAVAGKADYLIYGVVEAGVQRTINPGLVFAKAKGQLVAVRVDSRRVLAKISPETRGPGRNAHSASDRALSALSRKAFEELSAALSATNRSHR